MHPAAQRSPVGCIASIQFYSSMSKSPVALRKARWSTAGVLPASSRPTGAFSERTKHVA